MKIRLSFQSRLGKALARQLLLFVAIVSLALLPACGGGGGGTRVVGLQPENPYAYQSRGCSGAETGRIYQRQLADAENFNTTDTYVFRATNGNSYYVKATPNGSLYSVNAPSNSGGLIEGVIRALSPIPLPSTPAPTGTVPRQGDALFLNGVTLPNNSNPASVRVFEQGQRKYFAVDMGQNCAGDANLGPGVFAFPANQFAVPPNRTVFALRDEFRGYMSGKGVEAGNFRFLVNDGMNFLQMEHQADLYESEDGGFSIVADTGFKRWEGGKHSAVYGKLTAQRQWSENADLYMQASAGDLESDFYNDSLLHGFSAGVFAEELLRHNDFWHARIEQPFSSPEKSVWQIAADVRIGSPKDYFGVGAVQNLSAKNTEFLVFYHREF